MLCSAANGNSLCQGAKICGAKWCAYVYYYVSAENGYILYAANQRKWFLVSLANDQTSFNTEWTEFAHIAAIASSLKLCSVTTLSNNT